MAITRAAVEAEVVSEAGPLLALAAKSVAVDGTNADLNGPIAFALQALGLTPADPTLVVDGDLAAVGVASWTTLVGVAQYYAIQKSLNSLVIPDESAQDRRQDWSKMLERFERMLARLGVRYSVYLAALRGNVVVGTPASRFPDPRVPATWGVGTGQLDH